MRYRAILTETFRVVTTDQWANRVPADALLGDVDRDKLVVKWGPENRNQEVQILAVFPFDPDEPVHHREHPFRLILFGDASFWYGESYRGEVVPVLRFLLARWPAYAEFVDDRSGRSLRDLAQQERPRLAANPTWLHGTSSVKAARILRLGLAPQTIDHRLYRGVAYSLDNLVYLTDDREIAMVHARNAVRRFGGAPTILQVDLRGLQDRIVTDQDVDGTLLRDPSRHRDITRIQRRPGEASYLTLGTIAVRGRIPPDRIRIAFQGKPSTRRPFETSKAAQLGFIQALSRLAGTLSAADLTQFFHILALPPAGANGRAVQYDAGFYANAPRAIYSAYHGKAAPARFAQWLRGMQRRASIWREPRASTAQQAIMALLDTTLAKLADQTVAPAA